MEKKEKSGLSVLLGSAANMADFSLDSPSTLASENITDGGIGSVADVSEDSEDPIVAFRIRNYSATETSIAPPNAVNVFPVATSSSVSLLDFTPISVIGKGAYGKLFAMKVLRKATLIVHTKTIQHTKNERSILEKISHPFIVKLWYAFQTSSKLFLILAYAPGGELFNHLNIQRMFSEDTASFYIGELLLAIGHLHSLGILYRDLKPENVLLDSQGHVLLTDFGLSKVSLETQTVCGTIEFTAPEVLDSKSHYGVGVDHWSLGIMLYDMITGSPPFYGQNRKKVMEAILHSKPKYPNYISSYVRDLLSKLLKKDPNTRIGSGVDGVLEIQRHSFFRKINWKLLEEKKVTPPIIPEIKAPEDLSNFDTCFTGMPLESPPLNKLSSSPSGASSQGSTPIKKKKSKKKAAAVNSSTLCDIADLNIDCMDIITDSTEETYAASTGLPSPGLVPTRTPPITIIRKGAETEVKDHHFLGFSYTAEDCHLNEF